jgi:hypothetical protein
VIILGLYEELNLLRNYACCQMGLDPLADKNIPS